MNVTRAVRIHLAALSAGHGDFEDTLALVERYFYYTPCGFQNGPLFNAAGENEGSCKLFALAQYVSLTEAETLQCFGRHYQNVLDEPAATSHSNIRQFIGTGWSGIQFESSPLRPRPEGVADNIEEEVTS